MPYRIKHKKSGLYYCPSRRVWRKFESGEKGYVRSNLSKTGKIYHSATLKWLQYGYYSHLSGCPKKPYDKRQKRLPFVEKEWELEAI